MWGNELVNKMTSKMGTVLAKVDNSNRLQYYHSTQSTDANQYSVTGILNMCIMQIIHKAEILSTRKLDREGQKMSRHGRQYRTLGTIK